MRRLALLLGLVVVIGAGVVLAVLLGVGPKLSAAKECAEPVDPKLVDADTGFGFKLLRELALGKPDENVFISPAGISIALSMTCNGASGETRDAMAKTLEIGGMRLDELNRANSALLANLQGPGPGVEIKLANSLWAQQGWDFRDDFLQRNREFYGAEITSLDLQRPDAKDTINAWVDEKTEGKIPEIIDRIPPATILYLVNAISFKGEWRDEFDPSDTNRAEFTLPDGGKKTVMMMSREGEYRYLEEAGFQAIRLPYGRGRLAMYIFLPARTSSLKAFLKNLTPENWDKWMGSFTKRKGTIWLPRFKLEYSAELSGALKVMGMGIAFDETRADFRAMTPFRPVWINRVLHKTFVEVNEEGTEAAAATAVEMVGKVVRLMGFTMVVDRPFFCAITDGKTGAVLFLGAVVDP